MGKHCHGGGEDRKGNTRRLFAESPIHSNELLFRSVTIALVNRIRLPAPITAGYGRGGIEGSQPFTLHSSGRRNSSRFLCRRFSSRPLLRVNYSPARNLHSRVEYGVVCHCPTGQG